MLSLVNEVNEKVKRSKRKLVGSGKIKNLSETNPVKYKQLYEEIPKFDLDEYGYYYFPKNLRHKYKLYQELYEKALENKIENFVKKDTKKRSDSF